MKKLIEAYQMLFPTRHSLTSITTIIELKSSIRIELKDELTHPRVRKSPLEKLQFAKQRIENSDLSECEKTSLMQLYNEVYENVNTF